MDKPLPDWPAQNYPISFSEEYREAALGAPMDVSEGFSEKASRALLAELLPRTRNLKRLPGDRGRWPWERPEADDTEVASRVARLISEGADPSFRLRAAQGHFMPLGVAAWLGLEQTVEALIEAGAAATWPTADDYVFSEAEEEILVGKGDFKIGNRYRGIPLDPLGAATQALGVVLSLEYDKRKDEEGLRGIIRITERLGRMASPFREDPGTHRTPLEELFQQTDYKNSPDRPRFQEGGELIWTLLRRHSDPRQLEKIAKDQNPQLFVRGGRTRVPDFLAAPIRTLALEWLMERNISPDEDPASHLRRRSPSRF